MSHAYHFTNAMSQDIPVQKAGSTQSNAHRISIPMPTKLEPVVTTKVLAVASLEEGDAPTREHMKETTARAQMMMGI